MTKNKNRDKRIKRLRENLSLLTQATAQEIETLHNRLRGVESRLSFEELQRAKESKAERGEA